MSSLDPHLTSDGKLYAPERYKEIVKERYLICNNTNITYSDTGKMTPTERRFILLFIKETADRRTELLKSDE